jgi:hypothetical protein
MALLQSPLESQCTTFTVAKTKGLADLKQTISTSFLRLHESKNHHRPPRRCHRRPGYVWHRLLLAPAKLFRCPSNILQHKFQRRGSFWRLKYRWSNSDSNSDINTHLLQYLTFSNIQIYSHRDWTGNMVHESSRSHHRTNYGIVGAGNHAYNTFHLPAYTRRQPCNRRLRKVLPRWWSRELWLRASNPRGLSCSRSILPWAVSRPHIMPPSGSLNPPNCGSVQKSLGDCNPNCYRRRFD